MPSTSKTPKQPAPMPAAPEPIVEPTPEPVEPTPVESAMAELKIDDSATPAPETVVHVTYGDLFGDLPPSMIRLALKRLETRGPMFSPALEPPDEDHRSVVTAVVGAVQSTYLKKKEKARLASARRRQAAKLAKAEKAVDQNADEVEKNEEAVAENSGANP